MNYHPQHFEAPDGTRCVIITDTEYQRLSALDGDMLDIAEGMAALAQYEKDGVAFPSEVVTMIVDGHTPVGAWRRYRGITQSALAAAVGMSPSAINALEKQRGRTPRPENRHAIAKALDISPRALDLD